MPSDYEAICQDNVRRRGEEFDDIGRLISEQLYSDRTHFIYELLQNAEDALARRHRNNPEKKLPDSVKFILHKDQLEFRHFGEEFNTYDVKGISDVLKGTKSTDRSQIGKFGIGFKSVYAFTSTPEIHSGDEHFIIERYIRPRATERIHETADRETVFVFPFNHKNLSKEQAFHLIEKKLKKIGSRVLLFLKYISEIEWKIEGQEEGQYLKDSKQHGRLAQEVTVIGQHGNEDEEEEWLVFDHYIESDNSHREGIVEIAFKLKQDEKSTKQKIVKIESSPLNVYFPTKLETNLGFLVQGPYDTTASRSDIEENDWNTRIIEETASLLTEMVLPTLKKIGLLTVSLLEALPIKPEYFPQNSVFRPIYDKIRAALQHQDFLPTADGKHVAGKYAVLARAEDLIQLLSSAQLSSLLDKSKKLEWLTPEITETKKDIYRYLVGWKPNYWETGEKIEPFIVAEIRPENMIEELTPDFLKEQSIAWLLKLYAFFQKRPALIDRLRNKPIIRLEDGTYVSPFKQDGSPSAFLPPENETEFPVVNRKIAKNEKALEFLRNLRLTEPDAVDEVIGHILPKYSHGQPDVSDDKHLRDMKKILHAYSTEDSQEKKSLLTDRLADTAFINAENPVLQQMEYKKPGQLYFQNEDLLLYFEGNKDAWFVSSEYDACFYDLFKDLGITDTIRIRCKSKNGSAEYVKLEYKNGYRRGLKGFDPDIHVDGLEDAIRNPSTEGKEIIWNKIAIKYSHCIKGKVLRSSRQDFSPNASTYKEDEITTNFGHLLIDKTWLPSPDGSFVRPNELSLDDLPIEFEKDTPRAKSLSLAMRMKQPEHEQALEVVTEGDPDLKMLIEHYQSASDAERKKILKSIPSEHPPEPASFFKEGLKKLGRRQRGTPQHGGTEGSPVSDTDRYQDKLKEDVEQEVAKYQSTSQTISFSPVRDRFINAEARDFLYEQYHGRCQVTGTTFPKASRNINDVSENYFESCALLSYTNAGYLNDAGNMLCVSANTMAKFKCASIEFLDSLEDTIESFKLNSGQVDKVSVRIRLAGEECSIKWTQRHFMHLIALYEKA